MGRLLCRRRRSDASSFQGQRWEARGRGWGEGFLNLFACRFSLSVEEVQVDTKWVFERGRYAIQLTPKAGGEPLDENGKYITIYQRQPDGSWKTARDIWNSDEPLPGAR